MELETNDTEPSSTPFERELSLAVAITLLLISIGSIVANALLLSAIYNNPYKCLRSPPIYYIANLAFADLLTGLFCSLYVVYDLGLYLGKEYVTILKIFDYASYITVNDAICTIIFLSIDRSIAIKKPFFYRRIITAKTVAVIVAGCWMYAIFFSTFPLMGMSDIAYTMLDTYLHFIFAFVALTCLFAFIYNNLKQEKRTANLRTFVTTESVQLAEEQRLREIKNEKRLLVTIFLNLLVFFLCFAPYAVFVHLRFFCEPCNGSKVYYILGKTSEPIIYINSVLNPFIYAWRHKNFRKALLWTVRCRNRPSKHETYEGQTTSSKAENTNSVEIDVA